MSPSSCTARAATPSHTLPCQLCWVTGSTRAVTSCRAAGWGGKVSQRTHVPSSVKSRELLENKSSLTKTGLNYQCEILSRTAELGSQAALHACASTARGKRQRMRGWQRLGPLPSWGHASPRCKKRPQSCTHPPSCQRPLCRVTLSTFHCPHRQTFNIVTGGIFSPGWLSAQRSGTAVLRYFPGSGSCSGDSWVFCAAALWVFTACQTEFTFPRR